MGRLLKNPEQTADSQIYHDQNNVVVNVPKEGYWFSDDESMDEVVNYFIEELGFIQVKGTKTEEPKKPGFFSKKEEPKEETNE